MSNQRQSLTRLPSVTEETSSGLQHPVESDRMDGKEPPQHAGQLDAPQAGSSMSSESNRQQSENRTGVDLRLSSAPQAGMSSMEYISEHHDPPQTGQSLVDKSGSQQNRIDAEQQYGLNPPKAPQHGNSLLDKDNQIDQPGSCGQSRGPQTGNSLQDQQCNENENAQLNKTGPIKGPQSGESIEQVSDRQNIGQIEIKQFIVSQEDSSNEVLVSLQGLMNSCGGVAVTINPNQITFEGTGDFILKASLLLCKNNLPNKKLYVSDVAVDLLKKNLERVCSKENICVSWTDGVATIYALDKDVLDRAERLINDELSEIPIPAEQFQVEFIKNKLKDTFDEISEIFDQNGGHVVNDGKSINAAVFGKRKEITSAEKKLRDLVKSIEREQRTIDHPGIQKYFESQGGQYALLGIEAKHTVVVKCREQPGSLLPGSVSTQTQPRVYKVCVLVDVIACSRTDIDHAFKDIMHLCDEVVKKQIFADTKQKYSKILAKLSNSQVEMIEKLQQNYSVEIVLEPFIASKKSSTVLTVRGLDNERSNVFRELMNILK